MLACQAGVRTAVATRLYRRMLSEAARAHAVEITPTCVKRLKELQEQRRKNVALRVTVDGGGCSGFQYAFDVENWEVAPDQKSLKSGNDVLFEKDGAAVIVDNLSLAYISGSKVDYIEEMISSSFRVTENPNSETSCGCGTSFSPKL
ncbi:unnamed protein product [Chondrus crispus]|uniref:Core domain-containing protein n=1 Tax=Chondrus crispus TaxID=2769 RepID=R7QGG7_CHOCR|nr:unnamed protein product [Chondrus crispus]CDF36485.1 unnamed protein product [Chondrus crispus]|eukprot:XP_005716304.1 unnamed protein product [Chondrus crispus]